jgi:hypothetical protein
MHYDHWQVYFKKKLLYTLIDIEQICLPYHKTQRHIFNFMTTQNATVCLIRMELSIQRHLINFDITMNKMDYVQDWNYKIL